MGGFEISVEFVLKERSKKVFQGEGFWNSESVLWSKQSNADTAAEL